MGSSRKWREFMIYWNELLKDETNLSKRYDFKKIHKEYLEKRRNANELVP
jgi:hypothetical protein